MKKRLHLFDSTAGSRGPRPVARVGPFVATMPNGVFGDPLLHVRIPFRKRSLLVDLGEGARLPARTAHQVTDVFLSHTHIDHIAGFLSFLRSRIGEWPSCRVFGPPGVAGNIAGLVAGVHWDRIGHRAPRFDVAELSGDKMRRFTVIAGHTSPEAIDERDLEDRVILSDSTMRVAAIELDHQTPVLAFGFEASATIRVRKDKLDAAGLAPGPWLTDLKELVSEGELQRPILLPDGSEQTAGQLATELLLVSAGEKLVYATDLADTPDNRTKLQALASGAHTFFCEAAFCDADVAQAGRTGHLTTTACGEIATAANVRRLFPFHFSRRYEADPGRVYREVLAACPATVMPEPSSSRASD